jgi:deoxyribodipyrimidine photo-lyase
MSKNNVLIYVLRRDLRVADNPILNRLATTTDHGFTHLVPVYVFPPHQIEVSGFIKDGSQSPFPEARSTVGRYWRCGPHRAKFIGESVWDVKKSLESLGSGLLVRIGKYGDVVQALINGLREKDHNVSAVWMTSDEGVEEKRDEKAVATACAQSDVKFEAWHDEKYFIDE